MLILLHAGGRCANHVPFPPIASISKRCAGQLRVPHPRLVRVGLSFRVPHSGRPRLVTNGLLRWTPLRPVTGVELTYAEFAPTPWVGARVSQSSETKGPTLTRRGWGTPKDQALAPVSTPCVIPPWWGRPMEHKTDPPSQGEDGTPSPSAGFAPQLSAESDTAAIKKIRARHSRTSVLFSLAYCPWHPAIWPAVRKEDICLRQSLKASRITTEGR